MVKPQITWSLQRPHNFLTLENKSVVKVYSYENGAEDARTTLMAQYPLPFNSNVIECVSSTQQSMMCCAMDETNERNGQASIKLMKFKDPSLINGRIDPTFEKKDTAHSSIAALSWNDKNNKLLSAGKLKAHGNGYMLWDLNSRRQENAVTLDDYQQEVKCGLWVNAHEFCISVLGDKSGNIFKFDTRQTLKKSVWCVKNDCTLGLTFSNENYMASYSSYTGSSGKISSVVKSWDCRTISTNSEATPNYKNDFGEKNELIEQIQFSPCRTGFLGILTSKLDKDEKSSNIIVKEFHHPANSEDSNDQIFHTTEHKVIDSKGSKRRASRENPAVTFSWHPSRSGLIALDKDAKTMTYVIKEKSVISAHGDSVVIGKDGRHELIKYPNPVLETFKNRAENKYGFPLFQTTSEHVEALKNEPMYRKEDYNNTATSQSPTENHGNYHAQDFAECWEYLMNTRRADQDRIQNTINDSKVHVQHGKDRWNRIYQGAAGILLNEDHQTVITPSKREDGLWHKSESDKASEYTSTIYKSNDRERILKLCDYYDPVYHDREQIDAKIESLKARNMVTKAAAYALFCRMKWRATKILKEQGDEKTQLIRYSIAGFTNDFNSDWHKQVQEVFQERHKVHDPYVRAMLGFLTEKYEPESSCDYVLKETDLDVKDRVAFAAIYLSDTKLPEFLSSLGAELTQKGCLMGVLVTGFKYFDGDKLNGRKLLEKYMDKSHPTTRLQTAVFIALHAFDEQMLLPDNKHNFEDWFRKYTAELQNEQMYNERCEFEQIVRSVKQNCRTIHKENEPVPTIIELCQFCTRTIKEYSTHKKKSQKGRPPPVATECVCKQTANNYDRRVCSICQLLVTQMSEIPPVFTERGEDKFPLLHSINRDWIICLSCGHGGHTNCLIKWFEKNMTCPFGTCTCFCSTSAH